MFDENEQAAVPGLTRRGICAGALAGLGLAALPLTGRAASAGAFDLSDPRDLLRAYVKMRCSLGPELTIGWLRGKRFSVSEGRVEPLCGMLAAGFSKLHRVSDDEYEIRMLEVTFYTDFETGELIDRATMPFSGSVVDVPVHRFGPQPVRFAVDLDETEHFTPKAGTNQAEFATAGSVSMSKSIEVDKERDGLLTLRHEEYGRRYPADSDRPSMFYRESTLWTAPTAEVLDPTRQQVSSEVAYAAMTSWRPWMAMGDIPGHTFSNGFGRRVQSVDELPADYRGMLRRRHPDVLEDIEGVFADSPANGH